MFFIISVLLENLEHHFLKLFTSTRFQKIGSGSRFQSILKCFWDFLFFFNIGIDVFGE